MVPIEMNRMYITDNMNQNFITIAINKNENYNLTSTADSFFLHFKSETNPLSQYVQDIQTLKKPYFDLINDVTTKINKKNDSAFHYKEMISEKWLQFIQVYKQELVHYIYQSKDAYTIIPSLYDYYLSQSNSMDSTFTAEQISKIENLNPSLYNNISKFATKSQQRDIGKAVNNYQFYNYKTQSSKNLFNKDQSYSVIYLWASWCMPCRQANTSYLKEFYSQLKNKKIDFIGVSIDKADKEWIAAIEKIKPIGSSLLITMG